MTLTIVLKTFVILNLFVKIHAENAEDVLSTNSLYLSKDDFESLRREMKITSDPECAEALQKNLTEFLKRVRETNGTRTSRQDDGDDGDDGDGDGDGGNAGGGLFGNAGGAGGLLQGFMLPPVVPQILGTLTQAFTGVNDVVNQTSGSSSIPNFIFNQFSNLVGQFTGQKPQAATPPPYYPVAPGALRPGNGGQVRPPLPPYQGVNQFPVQRPGQTQSQQQVQGGSSQYPSLRPGHDPIQPPGQAQLNSNSNTIQSGAGSQQQSSPAQRPAGSSQSGRPPYRVRSPRPKPRPKPGPSEPPKSSLWNIYKSFTPAQGGPGSLTDFQLAHPEGFHSELLSSISSSLNKGRGTTERSTNESPIFSSNKAPSSSSSDIQQSNINNNNQELTSSNQFFIPSYPSSSNNNNNINQNQDINRPQESNFEIASTPSSSQENAEIVESNNQETNSITDDLSPAQGSTGSQKPTSEPFAPPSSQNRPQNPIKIQESLRPQKQPQPEVIKKPVETQPIAPIIQNRPEKPIKNRPSRPSNQGLDPVYPTNFKEYPAPLYRPQKPISTSAPILNYNPEPPKKPSSIFQKIPVTLPPEILSVIPQFPQYQPKPQESEINNNFISLVNETPLNPSILILPEREVPSISSSNGSESQEEDIAPVSSVIFASKPVEEQNIFIQETSRPKLRTSTNSPIALVTEISYTDSERQPIRNRRPVQQQRSTSPPRRDQQIVTDPTPDTGEKFSSFSTWDGPSVSTTSANPLGGRPVIVNNVLYPNLEAALASKDKDKESAATTSKPRRRRRSTSTTTPVPESDYYDEEPVGTNRPKRRRLTKLENLN